MATTIEWTEETWNPVTGCQKISPGCKHCYAENVADRFFGKLYKPNADGSARKFTDVRVHPERLEEPIKRRKPTMYFVNSMSDLFHESVEFEFILDVFRVMAGTQRHTYQTLTKRPERMLGFFNWASDYHLPFRFPLTNVWLGVSVESQKYANERITLLQHTPAAIRFLSVEPMLEEVSLSLWLGTDIDPSDHNREYPGMDWVICGGESGPGSRPFHLSWADKLRLECSDADVSFFMKQIGSNPRSFAGTPFHTRDHKGGDMSEWPERLRVRQWPKQMRKGVAA